MLCFSFAFFAINDDEAFQRKIICMLEIFLVHAYATYDNYKQLSGEFMSDILSFVRC